MQKLKERASILAVRDVPVLIQGETGTGKELFARAIHNIGKGFNIHDLIDDIERHYVQKACQQAGQRNKQAAELLGYHNYQTFDKRLKKLGLDD